MTQPGMIDSIAEAIALAGNGGTWDDWYNEDQKEFHRKRVRAAMEAVAIYYEGALDAIGYGNISATESEIMRARAVAEDMRRILAKS